MAESYQNKKLDILIQKMDDITKLADAMVQLPVRPSISVDDFIQFEKFDESTKYQDDLAPALRQNIKNLYPLLSEDRITKEFCNELRSAKDRLRYKNIQPTEADNHKHD